MSLTFVVGSLFGTAISSSLPTAAGCGSFCVEGASADQDQLRQGGFFASLDVDDAFEHDEMRRAILTHPDLELGASRPERRPGGAHIKEPSDVRKMRPSMRKIDRWLLMADLARGADEDGSASSATSSRRTIVR